ncbi:protein of unknown function [Taphrina deformans PYCC 5710]|uniref:Uncharacterized protein n=1 Tax=Taphrina deformans (strain PYCC 5710 / ATCC 11124 / CBS 356.35 / IMI 108563 / JCM 9778 / NBRC 8474) TaxID=1097556 RepID=R4XE92_TAPDE|nr:protein of unknown function [Taphrina deformans PYCC 5710]|eukprot:CCG84116.1 protein of unknown function [Taphrina deformans PYCC 5710]
MPESSFQGVHSQDFLECTVVHKDRQVLEVKCGDRGTVMYNGDLNTIRVEMENEEEEEEEEGNTRSYGHADLHVEVAAQLPHPVKATFPGMNYHCDLAQHDDTKIYAWVPTNIALLECRKNPLVPF